VAARWAGVQRFYRETVAELRRVQWPDRLTTRNLTLVVIGMSVALSAVLGAFDLLMTKLFQWLLKF
jgi:preprotein translocase subunit SecE